MNRLDAMQPSEIRELHNDYRRLEAEQPTRSFIPLHFGEPDLGTPSFIVEAGCSALRNGVVFYEDNSGRPDLKEALAAHYGLTPDHFVITCGGTQAIALTMLALLSPGDSVLHLTPCWPNITEAAKLAGAGVKEVALRFDESSHRFTLDFDALLDTLAATLGARMLIVNSPCNPTGWVIRPEERSQLHTLCREHNLILMSDEIYDRILFTSAPFPSALGDAGNFERVVVINGFSKTYCMTGWRIGYLITQPARAARMAQMQEFLVSHAPGAGQVAAITALKEGESFVDQSVERYRTLRDRVSTELNTLDHACVAQADGTFYTFFSLPASKDSVAFCRDLLRETGVVLAPGRAFGAGGEGWIRLCCANEPDRLSEAICRIGDFIAVRKH
jgi:aspartate/methionine/tyrosine aminotransferase